MGQPTVTITILAYRSKRTIRQCIESALGQNYPGNIDIRIREQGGDDEEYALLKSIAAEPHPSNRSVTLSRGENLGFAAGHNTLIRAALEGGNPPDFILCLNADAMLTPNFLSRAIPAFNNPAVGAVQGKLLRWDTVRNDMRRGPNGRPIIDTTGLLPLRNRRIINRGQGEEDCGQYDHAVPLHHPGMIADAQSANRIEDLAQGDREIFGVDGACALYRTAALEDVRVPVESRIRNQESGKRNEIFDEDFFLYKEDVDLAWRLQWRGWKTLYVPEAVAWHGRGSGESAARSAWKILAERRKISPIAKYYSFVNQRLMQIKNETLVGLLRDFLPWFTKEVAAWGVALMTERKTWRAPIRILRLLPQTLRKRRWIQSHRKPGADPYQWFR